MHPPGGNWACACCGGGWGGIPAPGICICMELGTGGAPIPDVAIAELGMPLPGIAPLGMLVPSSPGWGTEPGWGIPGWGMPGLLMPGCGLCIPGWTIPILACPGPGWPGMLGPKLACPGPEPGIPILGGIPGWPAADMGGMGPAWTPGDTERGPWCMMGESPERGTGISGMSDLPLA